MAGSSGGSPVAASGRSTTTVHTPASLHTASRRCQRASSSSGPAATTTRDPVRRISCVRCSPLSAGLTGAAMPTACAASVAAYSVEVLTPHSVTASSRRTPSPVRAFAICVTRPASSA
jgi:hypothetical protein